MYDSSGRPNRVKRNQLFTIVLLVLGFGVFLTLINIYELRMVQSEHLNYHDGVAEAGYGGTETKQPVVWVNAKRVRIYQKHYMYMPDIANDNVTMRQLMIKRTLYITVIKYMYSYFQATSGYLKHVFNVFERCGYAVGNDNSNWDVLWSHEYPFVSLKTKIGKLKPHQKVMFNS